MMQADGIGRAGTYADAWASEDGVTDREQQNPRPLRSGAYQLGALTARTAEHPVGLGKQSMLHRR